MRTLIFLLLIVSCKEQEQLCNCEVTFVNETTKDTIIKGFTYDCFGKMTVENHSENYKIYKNNCK